LVIGRSCSLGGDASFDVLLLHSLCIREIIRGIIVSCKEAKAFLEMDECSYMSTIGMRFVILTFRWTIIFVLQPKEKLVGLF
jgi:hypothetical protein